MLEQYHSCNALLEQCGCYDRDYQYKKYITKESAIHPAKMSWGVLEFIFNHLKEGGHIDSEQRVIDFMAGTGRTLIMAELMGFSSVGVELEPHFINLIKGNVKQLESILQRETNICYIQGDARDLFKLINKSRFCGIISPPYCEAMSGGGINIKGYNGKYGEDKDLVNRVWAKENLAGQRRRLLEGKGKMLRPDAILNDTNISAKGYFEAAYSYNPNNVGNLKDTPSNELHETESYLSAMKKIYSEAFRIGVSPIVTVTKNPTQKGILRRLDLDTAKLLMDVGYELFDYHRTILFKEQTYQTLDGTIIKKPKGRLSFFKRISYQKGNIVARWEDIIFAKIPKPNGLSKEVNNEF